MHSSCISPSLHEMCHPTATPSPLRGFPGREEIGDAPFWLPLFVSGSQSPLTHTHRSRLELSPTGCLTLTSTDMNTKAAGPMSVKCCMGSLSPSVCFTHSPSPPHPCAYRHLFLLLLFGIGGGFKEQGSVLFTLFAVSHSLLAHTIWFARLPCGLLYYYLLCSGLSSLPSRRSQTLIAT